MNEGKREEARAKWVEGRISCLENRWGSEFAEFVRERHREWNHLDAAEAWAGICWGMIGRIGPQDLDEVAYMEDEERAERIEHRAQNALVHGW